MGQHSAKFYETGGDSSGQLGGVIFFRRHRGGWFVLCRKESGGFSAADRLPRLGEMIKDFINVVELTQDSWGRRGTFSALLPGPTIDWHRWVPLRENLG